MENFFHFLFDVFEFDVLARLTIGGQDQVVAELSLDQLAHLIRLEREGRLSEGVDHGAGAGEVAEIPALSLGRARGFLAGDGGEGVFDQFGASLFASEIVGRGRQLC